MTYRLGQAIVALLAVIAIQLALLLFWPHPAEFQPQDLSAVTDELQQIDGTLQQLCTVTFGAADKSASPDAAQAACGNP